METRIGLALHLDRCQSGISKQNAHTVELKAHTAEVGPLSTMAAASVEAKAISYRAARTACAQGKNGSSNRACSAPSQVP